MNESEWRLHALSPLDGRYGGQIDGLRGRFLGGALIRQRFAVEVAWFGQLAALPGISELAPLAIGSERPWRIGWRLRRRRGRSHVKQIEAVTNHDVKAVEYYLKSRLIRIWAGRQSEPSLPTSPPPRRTSTTWPTPGCVRQGLSKSGYPSAEALGERSQARRPSSTPACPCWPGRTASRPPQRRSGRSWPCSWPAGSGQLRASAKWGRNARQMGWVDGHAGGPRRRLPRA